MPKPIRVAVTGAAGQISYSLLPRIANGDMFGRDQPVILQLLEVPAEKAMKALGGVAMELDDCAFPLLQEVIVSDAPEVAFRDADWCLLVGARPRGPGMERADLLKDNGRIFVGQGKAIDAVAADGCRVVVVGNPANTNCMIAALQARRLPRERFTAMMRLDQNRAAMLLAKKAGVAVTAVENLHIFGNHSPTMFPDAANARILGRSVPQVIGDLPWLASAFPAAVGRRGAAIIEARGASSALSAANALIDHVRDLVTPGREHSVAVHAGGAYGFAEDVWAGLPVRTTTAGSYQIIAGFVHDASAQERLAATGRELTSERDTVLDVLRAGTAP